MKPDNKKLKPVTVFIPKWMPDIKTLLSGTRLKPDRLMLYLHQVYLGRLKLIRPGEGDAGNSWVYTEGWSPLYSGLIKELVTKNYPDYVKFLEEHPVIERRRNEGGGLSYTPGSYSQLVRIMDNPFNGPGVRQFRKETISDPVVLKSIYRAKDKYKKNKTECVDHLLLTEIHHRLHKMELSVKFRIPQAEKFLDDVYYKTDNNKTRTKLKDSLVMMEAYNQHDADYCKVDSFGFRMHTPLTQTWKPLRSYMYFEGLEEESLMELDIRNSQFFFLATALVNPDIIRDLVPEFEPIIEGLKRYSTMSDVVRFHELCCEGVLYEQFSYLFTGTKQERRTASKECLIACMFSKSGFQKSGNKKTTVAFVQEFKRRFPNIDGAVQEIKVVSGDKLPFMGEHYTDIRGKQVGDKASHKNLSCLCQRLESKLVLNIIAERMLEQDAGPFLTVHDCWIVCCKKTGDIKRIIDDSFLVSGLVPPMLGEKNYPSVERL